MKEGSANSKIPKGAKVHYESQMQIFKNRRTGEFIAIHCDDALDGETLDELARAPVLQMGERTTGVTTYLQCIDGALSYLFVPPSLPGEVRPNSGEETNLSPQYIGSSAETVAPPSVSTLHTILHPSSASPVPTFTNAGHLQPPNLSTTCRGRSAQQLYQMPQDGARAATIEQGSITDRSPHVDMYNRRSEEELSDAPVHFDMQSRDMCIEVGPLEDEETSGEQRTIARLSYASESLWRLTLIAHYNDPSPITKWVRTNELQHLYGRKNLFVRGSLHWKKLANGTCSLAALLVYPNENHCNKIHVHLSKVQHLLSKGVQGFKRNGKLAMQTFEKKAWNAMSASERAFKPYKTQYTQCDF